jgi:hypothetical protein
MTGWHVTHKSKLGSIFRHGLRPRDTSEWNYPAFSVNAGTKAVYVWTERADADAWHTWFKHHGERLDPQAGPNDVILEVDLSGLPWDDDEWFRGWSGKYSSAKRVLERIPPERIRRIL